MHFVHLLAWMNLRLQLPWLSVLGLRVSQASQRKDLMFFFFFETNMILLWNVLWPNLWRHKFYIKNMKILWRNLCQHKFFHKFRHICFIFFIFFYIKTMKILWLNLWKELCFLKNMKKYERIYASINFIQKIWKKYGWIYGKHYALKKTVKVLWKNLCQHKFCIKKMKILWLNLWKKYAFSKNCENFMKGFMPA